MFNKLEFVLEKYDELLSFDLKRGYEIKKEPADEWRQAGSVPSCQSTANCRMVTAASLKRITALATIQNVT